MGSCVKVKAPSLTLKHERSKRGGMISGKSTELHRVGQGVGTDEEWSSVRVDDALIMSVRTKDDQPV